eukprot:364502-Chlamydomonas_euryale.AAC.20
MPCTCSLSGLPKTSPCVTARLRSAPAAPRRARLPAVRCGVACERSGWRGAVCAAASTPTPTATALPAHIWGDQVKAPRHLSVAPLQVHVRTAAPTPTPTFPPLPTHLWGDEVEAPPRLPVTPLQTQLEAVVAGEGLEGPQHAAAVERAVRPLRPGGTGGRRWGRVGLEWVREKLGSGLKLD